MRKVFFSVVFALLCSMGLGQDKVYNKFLDLGTDCEKIEFAYDYSKSKTIDLKVVDKIAAYFQKESNIQGYRNMDTNSMGRYSGNMKLFRDDLQRWEKFFLCEKQ